MKREEKRMDSQNDDDGFFFSFLSLFLSTRSGDQNGIKKKKDKSEKERTSEEKRCKK